MNVDTTSEKELSHPQPHARFRTRWRANSNAFMAASQGRRNAHPEEARREDPSRRAALRSGADMNSESEQDGHDVPGRSRPAAGHTVTIPKSEFARGRRLLAPNDQDVPLATVLMRGDAHFIDQRRKVRITGWSLPAVDDSRHVEDACLIGDNIVVVGYNKGPCQVSLIPVRADQRPRRIDLTYRAHSTVIENRASGTSFPNPGIACLAPVADDSFLSGGHDKTVRYWKVTRNHGKNANRAAYLAGSERIPTQHGQAVQALAYSSWNNTIYSTSGDFIATTRLDARAPVEPVRVSGKVNQVHVHPQDPRLIALEIDHMDYQVHFYDMREKGFGRKPWLEFGHRAAAPKPRSASRPAASGNASFAPKMGSRYIRGSTMNSLFARGYADGTVLVWDYRKGAHKEVLERFRFQRSLEIAHTVLTGADVIAYGGHLATFWSTLSD
ncbi:hypothetical protein BC628DRAFT_1417164 [Trametes gibbosa]|nr:hypothetical protein BC628DRAFT_1417164 [Trametes gibbosa]